MIVEFPDGTIVQAHIVTPLSVHSGQRATIAVQEQLLSGERTYEVVEARDAN